MKRNGRMTSNEIVLEHVLQRLRSVQFTGQIILHVSDGNIRKTETRDFKTTEELLTAEGTTR